MHQRTTVLVRRFDGDGQEITVTPEMTVRDLRAEAGIDDALYGTYRDGESIVYLEPYHHVMGVVPDGGEIVFGPAPPPYHGAGGDDPAEHGVPKEHLDPADKEGSELEWDTDRKWNAFTRS